MTKKFPIMIDYNDDRYQQDQISWIGDVIRYLSMLHGSKPFTIVDVGANKGDITDAMIAAGNNQHDIICVEPHPVMYRQLKKKFQSNAKVKVFDFVINDQVTEEIDFFCSDLNPAISHVLFTPHSAPPDLKAIKCMATTLNELSRDFVTTCSFVKVDAEGHDFRILQGATDLLKQHRPLVLFEFCGKMACDRYGFSPKTWYQFFQDLDYVLMSPINHRDEKYILCNFNRCTPDLVDLLAVPREIYQVLEI